MDFYTKIVNIFDAIVEYGILFIELIGISILLCTVVRGLADLLSHKDRTRLELARGFALSLEFKIGSELLRTVIVREWSELMMLGAIVLLRAALTLLIHWEIKIEKNSEDKTK